MKKTERIEQICIISACLMVAALLIWFTVCGAAYAETTATGGGAIDLTGLFNAAIAVLGALVTYRLIPWMKARTTQSQQEGLYACAKTLVYAAEQLYRTGMIQDRMEYVAEGLARRGYSFDRASIEAAVTQLRSDTGAYIKDLNIEEAICYEGGVCTGTAQSCAQVSAGTAEKAAGLEDAPCRASDCAAADCAEKGDEEAEESEEEDG